MSVDYIGDGDYYQGEFYFLLLTSVLGMIGDGVGPRPHHDLRGARDDHHPDVRARRLAQARRGSNEAAIKYFLIGVLSTAVMLYGMSIVFGETGGSTLLSDISEHIRANPTPPLFAVAIFLTHRRLRVQGRARCRSTSGRPTPTRARPPRSPRSCRWRRRRAGSSPCSPIVRFGFFPSQDSWEPVLWVLAAASMIYGNLVALRQTNIVRMLAYSSIAQGGFILVPLAVAGDGDAARASFEAVVIYLLIYGAMNLGAFAVVIAVARRTRSGEISSYAGLGETMPGLAITMTIFLFSLAGIPPFAGWFAKFVMFRAVSRRRHAVGRRARCDRRGDLGGRVLLLRRGGAGDVVPRARRPSSPTRRPRGDAARSPSPSASATLVVVVDRRLPAVLRPHRRARLPSELTS